MRMDWRKGQRLDFVVLVLRVRVKLLENVKERVMCLDLYLKKLFGYSVKKYLDVKNKRWGVLDNFLVFCFWKWINDFIY